MAQDTKLPVEFRSPGVCKLVNQTTIDTDGQWLRATGVGKIDELLNDASFFAYVISNSGAVLERAADGIRLSAAAVGVGLAGGGNSKINLSLGSLSVVTQAPGGDRVAIVDPATGSHRGISVSDLLVGTGSQTNLLMARDDVSVTINNDNGTPAIIPEADSINAGVMSRDDKMLLSSLSANSTNLGTNPSWFKVVITNTTGSDATIEPATTSLAGVMTADDRTLLNSLAASKVNLGIGLAPTTMTVTNTDGTNAVLSAANSTDAGVMSRDDKVKLDGMLAGNTQLSTGYGVSDVTVNNTTGTNATIDAASISLAGVMSRDDKIALNSLVSSPTDLGTAPSTTSIIVTNTSGTDATVPGASSLRAGAMSSLDKIKLDSMTAGHANLGSSPNFNNVVITNTVGSNATVEPATTLLSGVMSADDKVKLDSISASSTNLDVFLSRTDLVVTNTAGTDATLPIATQSDSGVMSADDKTLLDNIAAASTNLGTGRSANTMTVTNTSGSNAILPAADAIDAGVMSRDDKIKLDGLSSAQTDLQSVPGASDVVITNTTGTDATIDAANTIDAGVMTAADKVILDALNTKTFNLSQSRDGTTVTVNNTGGNPATLDAATTGLAGVMTADDRIFADKLSAATAYSLLARNALAGEPDWLTQSALPSPIADSASRVLGFDAAGQMVQYPYEVPKGFKSVYDLGYTGTAPNDNVRDAIQAGFDQGVSVHVPGGNTYLWDGRLLIDTSVPNFTIFGDGKSSHILQTTDMALTPESLINVLAGADGIRIEGIWFEGNSNGLSADQSFWYGAIRSDEAVNVHIQSCYFSGFAGYVTQFVGCSGTTVDSNVYWDNGGDDPDTGGQNNGDISLHRSTAGAKPWSTRTTITQNQCLSPNRIGIIAFSIIEELIVSNNIVTQLNSDLSEPGLETTNNFKRKDGITLAYNPVAIEESTTKTWQVTCTGNIVRNTIWSGIYINGGSGGGWDADYGPRITLQGNCISKACMLIAPGTQAWQGGIASRASRNVAIIGNVITETNLINGTDPSLAYHAAGIHFEGENSRFGEPEAAGSSIVGNIITETKGPAILILGMLDALVVNSNVCMQFYKGLHLATDSGVSGARGTTVTDNIFETTFAYYTSVDNTIGAALVYFQVPIESDLRSMHIDFSHNRVEMRGGVPSTAGVIFYTTNVTCLGNTIIGGDSVTASKAAFKFNFGTIAGVVGTVDKSVSGRDSTVIGDNTIKGYNIGYWSAHTDPSVSMLDWGPIPDSGSVFDDVPKPYSPSASHSWGSGIVPGVRVGENVQVWSSSLVAQGWWKKGDRIVNNVPNAGTPYEWICMADHNSAGAGAIAGNWQSHGSFT